jgi:transposase
MDIEQRCKVTRNDDGLRVVDGDQVRQLVAERDAAIEHQRIASERGRAHVAAQLDAGAARAKALAQRPRLQGIDDLPMNQAAILEMKAASGDYVDEFSESDARMEEMLANGRDGRMTYHPLPRKDDGTMTYHPYREEW